MDRHHRISAERIAIDSTPVQGGLPCYDCKRVKPLTQFPPSQHSLKWARCRMCNRISTALYRQTPRGKAATKEYRNRPEVIARQAAIERARRDTPARRAAVTEYRRSERWRILHSIHDCRYRLRKATTDEQRARIQSLIDRHTAALAALSAEDE